MKFFNTILMIMFAFYIANNCYGQIPQCSGNLGQQLDCLNCQLGCDNSALTCDANCLNGTGPCNCLDVFNSCLSGCVNQASTKTQESKSNQLKEEPRKNLREIKRRI